MDTRVTFKQDKQLMLALGYFIQSIGTLAELFHSSCPELIHCIQLQILHFKQNKEKSKII